MIRKAPSKRSRSSLHGCRDIRGTTSSTSRAWATCSASLSWTCTSQVRFKVRILRPRLPKLSKMKEMSNSNRKSLSQRISRKKSPNHRLWLNPSPKLMEALKQQAKPKRGRRRSNCPPSRLWKIIRAKKEQNSHQWVFQVGEPIWLEEFLHWTVYAPTSCLLTIPRANVRRIPTMRVSLSSRALSQSQPRRKRLRARRVMLKVRNDPRKVSLILNFC